VFAYAVGLETLIDSKMGKSIYSLGRGVGTMKEEKQRLQRKKKIIMSYDEEEQVGVLGLGGVISMRLLTRMGGLNYPRGGEGQGVVGY